MEAAPYDALQLTAVISREREEEALLTRPHNGETSRAGESAIGCGTRAASQGRPGSVYLVPSFGRFDLAAELVAEIKS